MMHRVFWHWDWGYTSELQFLRIQTLSSDSPPKSVAGGFRGRSVKQVEGNCFLNRNIKAVFLVEVNKLQQIS